MILRPHFVRVGVRAPMITILVCEDALFDNGFPLSHRAQFYLTGKVHDFSHTMSQTQQSVSIFLGVEMPQFDKWKSRIRLPGTCRHLASNSARICPVVLTHCSELRAYKDLLMPPIRTAKESDHESGQCCNAPYRLQSIRIRTSESAMRRFAKPFSH